MSAAAVAIAIAAVSALAWWATAKTLRAQIDLTLTSWSPSASAARDPAISGKAPFGPERLCQITTEQPAALRQGLGSIQIVRADGSVCAPTGAARVPVTA